MEKKKFYLKWPFNLIVYIVLVIVLRVFAIPVILLIMWWNKKQQPDGPDGGYCMDRNRKGLAKLFWALLYLFFGFAGGVCFYMQMQEDRSSWELMDWAFTVFSAVLCLGGTALGLFEAYTDLRDAFCPEKSTLAKSIRSQLPYPEEAPPVAELFAMVDRDVRENGQWFGRLAIGKEWVFGDEVTSLSRIRGVFPRDEIIIRHTNGRRQSRRVLELYLVDDRQQIQASTLHKPDDLKAAVSCLRLRVPEAHFDTYQNMSDFTGQSDEEWRATNSSYLRRRDLRLARREEEFRQNAGSNPDFVLVDLQGRRTSRFDRQTVEDQLTGLKSPGQSFSLEPVDLIPVPELSRVSFSRLECGITDGRLTLVAVRKLSGGLYQAFARQVSEEEAWQAFAGLLERKQIPDTADWQPLQAVEQPKVQARARLSISDRTGATRDYDSFTRRDVELAGEGLASGRYTVVALFAGPRYLYLKAGDQTDGRVTVNASQPGPDKLRVFETKCADRQAQTWLIQMSEGTFDPDFTQWKDITRQLEKEQRKTKT